MENYGTVGKATDDNTTWYMRFACWITKATNTHSEYVIFIAWQRQQRFCESVSMLRSTYIAGVCVRLITAWGLLLPTVSNVISFVFLEQMKSGFGTENNVGCTDFVIVLRCWKAFLSKMYNELLCHGLLQVKSWYFNFKSQKSLQNFVHPSTTYYGMLACRAVYLVDFLGLRTEGTRTSFIVASMTGPLPRLGLCLLVQIQPNTITGKNFRYCAL